MTQQDLSEEENIATDQLSKVDRFSQQFTTLLKVLFPVRSIVVVHNVQGKLYHVVV